MLNGPTYAPISRADFLSAWLQTQGKTSATVKGDIALHVPTPTLTTMVVSVDRTISVRLGSAENNAFLPERPLPEMDEVDLVGIGSLFWGNRPR